MIGNIVAGAASTLVLLCAQAGPAHAQGGIPISIKWEGEQPASISQQTAGGMRQLDYDAASRTFRGTLETTSTPQRRSLFVSFGGNNYPLDLRVSSTLRSGISFVVQFRPLRSCTSGNVLNVTKSASSMPDALNAMLAAGQLLNIASPNDCDSAQRRLAIQSRYMRSVQLGMLSGGLFMVREEFRSEFRTAEVDAGRTALQVDGQLANYAAIEQRLEAIQLVTARDSAITARDFELADQINTTMIARIDSDPAIRMAYERQGATRTRLVAHANEIRRAGAF